MKDVSAHLKSNEMDSVFYAVKSNQEVDLLNSLTQMDMNEVTKGYKQEQCNNFDKNSLDVRQVPLRSNFQTKSGREFYLQSKVMRLGPRVYKT